jgi:excinuclease ABC subunit A
VIKNADWIIDLGPETWPGLDPGATGGGGEIVREKRSYTGAFLKPVLARRGMGEKKNRVEAAE